MKKIIAAILCLFSFSSFAASGEMGTGIIGPMLSYPPIVTGTSQISIVSLSAATIPFPSGCSSVTMTAGTIGLDQFKINLSILLSAKMGGLPVRLYAHATRDSGCGIDFVQLN